MGQAHTTTELRAFNAYDFAKADDTEAAMSSHARIGVEMYQPMTFETERDDERQSHPEGHGQPQ